METEANTRELLEYALGAGNMSYEYSENKLVQDSAGNLLRDELGWEVSYAYNTEKLGVNGTFGLKN